jgi:sterol desaturase/sphingolipid hydroxylase (fatty acid hydroxylase superfamily)
MGRSPAVGAPVAVPSTLAELRAPVTLRATLAELRWPLALYAPASAALLAFALDAGSAARAVLLAAAGVALWTLMEYLIHRFLLHLIPRGSMRRYVAGRHILHHRDPTGHPGLVLLWVSGLVGLLTSLLLVALLGPVAGAAVMGGVVLGYLAYEYAHLAAHLGTRPLTPWGARLRAHHLAHHERSARANFAIVLPLWDALFRTSWRGRAGPER